MNSILEIKSISKTFTKKKVKDNIEYTNLINNFNLFVERGKITTLIGGNGAGKTTLFNLISGFIETDGGEILFNIDKKYKLTKMPPYKRENIGIGRLFQDNHIFPELTVFENLLIAYKNNLGELPFDVLFKANKSKKIEKKRREKAKQTLEILFGDNNEFRQKKDYLAKNMSYGQQRLIGLARLFMADYKLVLLDEPTAGVNPKLNDKIAEIIKQMVSEKNITVLMIEHNMHFVKQITDTCGFMNNGKIEILGTPEEIIANENVRKSYLGTS